MEIPLYLNRAVIEINGGCNYTCKMCPQTLTSGATGARGKDWLKKMSLRDFESVVSQSVRAGASVINLEGSGEPTLNRNLPEYISIVKKYGARPFIYTNGYALKGAFMQECVDAGLSLARFSIIGYDRETYKKWMNRDSFHWVLNNALEMREYVDSTDSDCIVASYHLILDNDKERFEVEQYKSNVIEKVNSYAEIWKMHNWSGVYDSTYKRKGKKRTCGRPFSPDLTVRAGGSNGTKLSVAPCCQTLGRDDEADLGSLSDNSLYDIWNGERYKWLRCMHKEERFDEVSFCKDCDFLYEDTEVLVWKNNDMVDIDKMKGTDFSLKDFRQSLPNQM